MNRIKVVHISTYLNGGAGSAAFRLHKALLESGVESYFLYLIGEEDGVDFYAHKLSHPKSSLAKRSAQKIRRILFGDKANLTGKHDSGHDQYKEIRSALKIGYASLPYSKHNLLNRPLVQNADIIHLHWVAGMLDYSSFFKNNKKPVVWTLHDKNPAKSVYHYDGDEKMNGHMVSDLDRNMITLKRNAIQNRNCWLTYVTPSQWLNNEVARSVIFSKVPGITIANTIDTREFKPIHIKELRKKMDIPEKNTIFLFVAEAVNYSRKGFDLLIEALEKLSNYPLTLIVIGNSNDLGLPSLDTRMLGHISDVKALREYYCLADAFIIPSREDNLPNVMLESMACGTPVLSFNVGGMASVITDRFNGLKANHVSSESLAGIIREFIETKTDYSATAIRNFALENFSFDVIAEKYIQVYKKSIAAKQIIQIQN